MQKTMSEDRRIQLRNAVLTRIEGAAECVGITPSAFIAIAVDEYLRARPDLVAHAPNTVSLTPEDVVGPDGYTRAQRNSLFTKPAKPVDTDTLVQHINEVWGED